MIGFTIGNCRLQRLIRRGSGGSLYEAVDLQTGERVAVKLFSHLPFVIATSKRETDRLWGVVCGFKYPGIVPVYRFGCEDSQHYAVMELAGEGDLNNRLTPNRGLDSSQMVGFVRQILLALDYLHGQGYLHLDVKPGNFLLYVGDYLKLSDFALLHPMSVSLSCVKGSPGFMSPEQIMGQPLDQRSDLFAVGVILYRMITGSLAFDGADAAQRLHNTLLVTPSIPSHIHPMIAPSLSQVMLRALAKRPSQRFFSAREFLCALEEAVIVGATWHQ